MRFQFLIFVILANVYGASTWAADRTYEVQTGDTLSQIARQFRTGSIYGPNGSLQQLQNLNPDLAANPNKIWPGEIIQIDQQEKRVVASEPSSTTATNTPARAIAVAVADAEPSVMLEPAAPAIQIAESGTSVPPPPSAAFTKHEERAAQPETHERSLFEIAPRVSFNRIDAFDRSTGGMATLGSNFGAGAEVQWTQVWSNEWMSGINAGFDNFTEQTTGKNLDHATFTSGFLALKIGHVFTPTLFLSGDLRAEQAPILRADGTNSLTLDLVNTPEVHLGLTKALRSTSLFELSLGAQAGLRLGTSQDTYDVQTGFDGTVFLALQQKAGSFPLYSKIFFTQVLQNTTLTKQSMQTVGLSIGTTFDVNHSSSSEMSRHE